MTTPVDQQQPQPQPQQPSTQQQVWTDAAIVAAIALLLAAVTPSAPSIATVLQRSRQRVSRAGALAAAGMVLQWSDPDTLPHGSTGARMQRTNIQRRAQYLLSAARRITAQLGTDHSRQAIVDALARERGYWRQHVAMNQRRTAAAATVDSVAEQHGPILGWAATLDARTDAQCRAAHGKNWLVNRPPRIGVPGTVHPACRCVPVAPWPTRRLVDGGLLSSLP